LYNNFSQLIITGYLGVSHCEQLYIHLSNEIQRRKLLHYIKDSSIETVKYFGISRRTLSRYLDKNKLFKEQWKIFKSLISKE
jgi:ribosomal protein S15P/S13E